MIVEHWGLPNRFAILLQLGFFLTVAGFQPHTSVFRRHGTRFAYRQDSSRFQTRLDEKAPVVSGCDEIESNEILVPKK